MRIIFNPEEGRVFSRNRSLSKKPLVIADDVNPTDDVEIQFLEDKILVKGTGSAEEITNDTEWLYIGKSVGLFGYTKELKSAVEIILCDEYIALRLMKGAVTVHPDSSKPEDVILVVTGLESDSYPAPYLNNIKWVDRDYFASFCKYFGDFAGEYPSDYMYQVVASGTEGGTCSISFAKLSMADISYGALALKKERMQEKERQKKLKAASSMFDMSGDSFGQLETFDSGEQSDDYDEDEGMYNY